MHHQAIIIPPHIIQIPKITSTHKCISPLTTYTPSNSSIQIQLPLNRPQHKHQSIKQPPKKINGSNPRISSTTSDILRLMDCLKFPITLDLYVSLIKECTKRGDPLQAIELHNHIRKTGISPTLPLLNLLLLMYVCCNCSRNARELFDKSSVRNVYSWAVIIAGHFENGDYGEVIDLFLEMQSWDRGECSDLSYIAVAGIVVCVLKACVQTMNLKLGEQVHGWIVKAGCSRSAVLNSSLMRFYAEFGSLESSENVFDQVPTQNTVVWTARIVNCCREERFDKAVHVFSEMGKEGVRKNSFTFSSVLKACGKMGDNGCCGRQVHASVIKLGLELDGYVQCGLVDMFGKCGLVTDARSVFNMHIDKSNTARWNALITGYVQQGLWVEATKILYEMKAAGLQPQESLLHEVRFLCGSYEIEKMTGKFCF